MNACPVMLHLQSMTAMRGTVIGGRACDSHPLLAPQHERWRLLLLLVHQLRLCRCLCCLQQLPPIRTLVSLVADMLLLRDLADDVLQHMLSMLSFREKLRVRLVCRRSYAIVADMLRRQQAFSLCVPHGRWTAFMVTNICYLHRFSDAKTVTFRVKTSVLKCHLQVWTASVD